MKATVDLDRWEPFDLAEFALSTGKGNRGLCSANHCDEPAVYMRWYSWETIHRSDLVRGFAACLHHAASESMARAQRWQGRATVSEPTIYYAEREGMVKIGCTRAVGQRMQALRTSLLATEPGSYELEAERHAQFDHLRIAGEWFRPGAALMAHIDRLEQVAS